MTITKILVPYNFTVHEWKAFDFIIKVFHGREDVKISLPQRCKKSELNFAKLVKLLFGLNPGNATNHDELHCLHS
jgi:hypothetical protein